MVKLKLGTILDDRPVKLTVELPAALHRDLVAYAELLGGQTGQAVEPVRLIAPMLARFISADRGFGKARRSLGSRAAAAGTATNPTPGFRRGSGGADE